MSTVAYATTLTASIKQHYASYVVLGQSPAGNNIALARVIIDTAVLCPTVLAVNTKKTVAMIPRQNPNHFSVLVCEAVINFDEQYRVNFSDGSEPLAFVKSNPKRIQVFGDSGCKAAKPGSDEGCAIGSPAQPFKNLANAGAKSKPDLILHMGDYNYRGTSGDTYFNQKNAQGELEQTVQWPYDAGDGSNENAHCEQVAAPFYSQSATNSNFPDIWRNWHDDLFKPAKTLMATAPFIVARGNHELCSRAGAGYFYFLDPHSDLVAGSQQISCPTVDVNKTALFNTVQIPAYKVSFANVDIAMLDSANACDSFSNSPFTQVYEKEFIKLDQLLSKTKPAWLLSHRPVWGITEYYEGGSTACTSTNDYGCVNQMMQSAIAKLPNRRLSPAIGLLLAGHMHRFQSVSFNQKRPPLIVVGTSGVKLDDSPPDGAISTTIDGLASEVLTSNNTVQNNGVSYDAFGYLDITLNKKAQWKAKLVNPPKKLHWASCTSRQNLKQGVCEFTQGISP